LTVSLSAVGNTPNSSDDDDDDDGDDDTTTMMMTEIFMRDPQIAKMHSIFDTALVTLDLRDF